MFRPIATTIIFAIGIISLLFLTHNKSEFPYILLISAVLIITFFINSFFNKPKSSNRKSKKANHSDINYRGSKSK